MSLDLLASTSRVETPIIIAEIAGVTFGAYTKRNSTSAPGTSTQYVYTKYPNYMTSLNITKINGALNTYTLTMTYAITQDDDPNLLEKIFSKAGIGGVIKLSYGDASIPSYIYKDEEAIITKIRSNLNIASSTIVYTIEAVSKALKLNGTSFNFPKTFDKPSDIIKSLLRQDEKYHLTELFPGMVDTAKINIKNLIASDDRAVTIEAKPNTSILDYIKYLVSCMSSTYDTPTDIIKSAKYTFNVYDDLNNELGGAYFKVSKVATTLSANSLDTYEINIGYPDATMVSNFQISDDQTYSILYNYSNDVKESEYVYSIDNQGQISYQYTPPTAKDNELFRATEAKKTWWTVATQFPITATLTIKGLLKPSILMTYIKLNTYFYGKKHLSSGYYIITKQVDTIDAYGYKTLLTLVRVAEDKE